MKKLLWLLILMVFLCSGIYLTVLGLSLYTERMDQWYEKRATEAAQLCQADETLKTTLTENDGKIHEAYDCEDAQGQRRRVTVRMDEQAPKARNRPQVWLGIAIIFVSVWLASNIVTQRKTSNT